MKIIIDISHPAHFHLFKNPAKILLNNGHTILFTCREKEFVTELLRKANFSYLSFGRKYKSLAGKIVGLIHYGIKEYIASCSFKPDIFLSHGSYCAAHAAFLLRKPHISMEDTFNFEQICLYKPFTDVILTSDYEHPLKSKKVLQYKGFHELAYLHKNRFIPDRSILNDLGVSSNEKFVLLRFISWEATHDFGNSGLSAENKIKAINEFSKYAKVFISSEYELPDELVKYRLTIPPDKIHDAIAFSSLLFGESSTMAEEAAMLGTPAIFIYKDSTVYTKYLESEYNLIHNYSSSLQDQNSAIIKGREVLSNPTIRDEYNERRERMLSEKIDVTPFLVWFVENWPESFRIMKENPGYQERFR